MPWADVWKDQETVDALTRQIRATTPLRGAAEIRAVLEAMAARERRKRAAVQMWQRAKGRVA